jgi:hypothetical protein
MCPYLNALSGPCRKSFNDCVSSINSVSAVKRRLACQPTGSEISPRKAGVSDGIWRRCYQLFERVSSVYTFR